MPCWGIIASVQSFDCARCSLSALFLISGSRETIYWCWWKKEPWSLRICLWQSLWRQWMRKMFYFHKLERESAGKKAKRTFVRNWRPGKHIGLRWEMIQSSMCLWTNLTLNTLQCIFDELQSGNRELSLCGRTVQILLLVREGHVILSVPLCWGFTSLPDAHPLLVNTKRRLSVSIKLISGQISILWFTVMGKNFHIISRWFCKEEWGTKTQLDKKVEYIGGFSVPDHLTLSCQLFSSKLRQICGYSCNNQFLLYMILLSNQFQLH